jgi:murein DD-endopeptidase MepM/ murein hydrolase activator NlpD
MVPLRGLQLLCCAAVAGLGVYGSARLFARTDSTAQAAVSAFELAALQVATAQTAADAALAGLSEIKVVVKANDTLDAIFRRLEISLTDLANMRGLEAARQGLDRLIPGDELTLATRDGQLVALQRPLSIGETLKVERDAAAGFVASIEQIPLTYPLTTTSGVIDSSLFAAAAAAGLRDATIEALSEIFVYDVDFNQDLRVGDTFKLVYEQIAREGEVVGDGKILAAEFTNDGKVFRAVRYERADGRADYYTPEGASLRKAFLKTPVAFSRISSGFNPRRRHPVLNTIRAHRGIDYAAASGTPVKAAGSGRVKFRGVKGGFGNVVELTHSNSVVTRYGHLSRFAKGLSSGQKVEQGQVIGYVGSTGLATGPHLHFEFIKGGQHVDPQKEMRREQPGPPVAPTERSAFNAQVAPLLASLDAEPAPTGAAYAAR